MTCTTCGADIREGAKFCSECGATTSRACPTCGTAVEASDKFCAECGTRLDAEAPRAPLPDHPAEDAQERRLITAVFVDLVGFTPLSEARDSEEVRTMLTHYFDRARDVVERFGGVIDKYIGDAVMAVWGAQVAHEDDAERAVRAGLELVEAVDDLGRSEQMPGLQARVGVLTGEAAVGGDGNPATGLIIGDTVNTASRLQGAAEPGTVLVGRATRDLAERAIEFESVGPVTLKGKAEPVETWRAVRVVGGARGNRRSDGLVPPFVGRTDELRLLKDNVHGVERDRRVRLVSIVGQGGIGKSRLMDEFWNYLDGLTGTTYWHHGRSPAYGDGISFWALGEMVRQRAGIAETDDDHASRTRLRTMLAEYVPDADDRAWMEPRLEGLLGLGTAAGGDRAELFAAWRMLFHRVSDHGPVVMAFEDLHWADDGILDFIEEMVSLGTEAPILIVGLARPDLLERRPGWGSGRSNTTSLHLAPLTPATMTELILGVVPDAPSALTGQLVERAGGIPLYAVELLRMLAARGDITPEGDGTFRLAGDVSGLDIPDSLQGLVGSRLDQFDPTSRALIADAAILGQSFTVEGLALLRGQSQDELVEQLEPLVRREILSINRDPRSPERGQYRFVQSIIREVAHQRISRSERVDRHMRVADYFESLDEPEVAGIIANHLLDALEAAGTGPDTDELRGRTVRALLAAADRAEILQSHAQVVRLCQRGIELTDDPSERGELLLRAARSAHAGLDPAAEELGHEAIAAFETAGDPVGHMRAATVLARHLDDIGRSSEGWQVLLDPVEAVPGETADHAVAMAELGRAYMLDQRYEAALPWCDRALSVAEQLDLVQTIAEAWTSKGALLGASHRRREAIVVLEAALELAVQHQLSSTKRRTLTNLSFVSAGESSISGDRFDKERLEDARRIGNPRQLAEALIAHASTRHSRLDMDGFERTMGEVDRDTLSPELRMEYDNALSWATMLRSGTPEPEIAARRERVAARGEGDSQTTLNDAMEEVANLYVLGDFAGAFDLAIGLHHHSPSTPDLSWATVSAIALDDVDRHEAVLEQIRMRRHRVRNLTLLRLANEAAIAALEGRMTDAAAMFEEVTEMLEEMWPVLYASLIEVGIPRRLGLDHPFGRRMANQVHSTWTDAGLTTLLGLHDRWIVSATADTRTA